MVAEDRARRRLILQLLHLMIIVKESYELILEIQRLTVASVKPVLEFRKNAAGPNGLAGREGRDTPADYRRVIAVLNFLKPCFPFFQKRTLAKLLLGIQSESRTLQHGLVTELAYVLDSKSRFCGFESHPGYQ